MTEQHNSYRSIATSNETTQPMTTSPKSNRKLLKNSYNIKNELSNNRIEVLIIFSAFLLKSDYVKHISIEKGQKGRL